LGFRQRGHRQDVGYRGGTGGRTAGAEYDVINVDVGRQGLTRRARNMDIDGCRRRAGRGGHGGAKQGVGAGSGSEVLVTRAPSDIPLNLPLAAIPALPDRASE